MFTFRFTAITTAFLFLGCFAEQCEAGPLLDWLRGRRNPYAANRYTTYYRGQAAHNQAMANPGYSQMPGTCMTTCPQDLLSDGQSRCRQLRALHRLSHGMVPRSSDLLSAGNEFQSAKRDV